MGTPIDETTVAPSADQPTQEPQDLNRASGIPRSLRPRTRSRTGSIPPRSRTGNIQHLPAVPDTDEETDYIPRFNPPRLPTHPIGVVAQGVTNDVVRSTYHEINEPIATRLKRLTTDLPINVETLEDLLTRLEMLESAQKLHQLETKPTVSAVSALQVDVNRLIETISTRVIDAQQQATVRQSSQDNPEVSNKQ